MSTVFVTLCDAGYYPRAIKTIHELRTRGEWAGDVCLIAVDFEPAALEGVQIIRTTHVPTDGLVESLRRNPIRPMDDNRHFAKLHQWDKLQVFTPPIPCLGTSCVSRRRDPRLWAGSGIA